jgi:hypothetical protein
VVTLSRRQKSFVNELPEAEQVTTCVEQ